MTPSILKALKIDGKVTNKEEKVYKLVKPHIIISYSLVENYSPL